MNTSSSNDAAVNGDTILKVNGLSKYFDGVPAVEDVSFDVRRSETLGIVGESGSGKTKALSSTTAATAGSSCRICGPRS